MSHMVLLAMCQLHIKMAADMLLFSCGFTTPRWHAFDLTTLSTQVIMLHGRRHNLMLVQAQPVKRPSVDKQKLRHFFLALS